MTFTDNQWLQACLPVKDGGSGVRSVATLALPAFLASAESTDEFQLRNRILEKTAIFEDLYRVTALESWLNETHVTQPTGSASHKQRNWDNVGIELRKKRLLANCHNDRDRARILASRARHAGAWLNALKISTCGLRMSNDVIEPQSDFDLDVDSASLTYVAAVLLWTRMEHTHWHATKVQQQDANYAII